MVVDAMALGDEQRRLDWRVRAVQASTSGHHSPPRETGSASEDVGHGLAAARSAELLRQFAVRHQLSRT